jgi:hypothetical protein
MSPKPPKKKAATKKPAVTWGQRPSARAQVAAPGAAPADSFVAGAKSATIRLNVNIGRGLHARIKSQCALEGRDMTEAITELLETRFPPPKGA